MHRSKLTNMWVADIVFHVVGLAVCILGVVKIRDPVWLPIVCVLTAFCLSIQFPALLRDYKWHRCYQEFGQ
jgi:hypothetical protein